MEASRSLTKETVKELTQTGGGALAELVERNYDNAANLVFVLENLGRLPAAFDAQWLAGLLSHENGTVRFWAVKNIGKLKSVAYLDVLSGISANDESTAVRREAVSAVGRMRSPECIPFLKKKLEDSDPKVVCQAIRGLLLHKGAGDVDAALKKLADHENETVRALIRREYFASGKSSKPSLPHAETFSFLKNAAVNGDVRDILRHVPSESVHLTFTSPPYYNARDYSIYPSYEAYLKFLEEIFRETLRVTKEGRFLVVNTSPVIVPRISRAHSSKRYPIPFDLHHYLMKMGWEFIDDIIWMKPEFSVKNRIGGFQQHRKPLAYKPNTVTEYLMVYRKQTDKLIDWNIHQYGDEAVSSSKVPDGYETTNVWQICPASDKVHSAIFPEELCKRVIEYYSFKGDLVFDPFGGSGTVGRAAMKLGRHFFLTEKEPRYFERIRASLQTGAGLFEFEEEPARFYNSDQFIEKCHDDN